MTFQPTRPIIPAGTQLSGIYEIDEPIAAGGMGEIYKGHAIETGDLVAIKLIRSDLAETEAASALFRKEASALHNLYHEAIVRYYVYTTDPVLGRPYLAMEFVDGQSLSALLRGGSLAFEAVFRLMQRIAAGLHAAHERGIIHRDVSPDNIIIPAGDMARAKIIDFGIARSTRLGDEGTIIGSGFAGKYNYVSPEQLGLFGGEVTPKSDIYSLGLVLAEALSGKPIDMGGNHVEVIEKRRAVPDLSGIDRRMRKLIERMLQPNPADRQASMAEVAAWSPETAQVTERADERSAPTRTKAPGTAARIGRKRIGQVPIAAGVALGLLVAGAAVLFGLTRPAPQIATQPPLPDLTHEAPQSLPAAPIPSSKGLVKIDVQYPTERPARAPDDPAEQAKLGAVSAFLAQYDEGGDCFFIRPVMVDAASAMIEGYGRSTMPFRDLDTAFRRANGFEPDIGVHQVAPEQCPAIRFLSRVEKGSGKPFKLDLAESSLEVGQPLKGTISGLDGREVSVIVVGDDGSVRVLPVTRSAGREGPLSFSWPAGKDLASRKLELVVAIASAKGLSSLRAGNSAAAAERVFAETLAEIARTSQAVTVAARSFKVAQ